MDLVPVMEVNSILTGRRGVSLPFSDDCEPVMCRKEHFDDMLGDIILYGTENRWKSVELRGGKGFLDGHRPAEMFYGHTLRLDPGAESLLGLFKSGTRRNIRKAIKEDVQVRISHSLDSVKQFCRLNAFTRRDHGLPPQPFFFFRNVHRHIISQRRGMIVLASSGRDTIAGAVFFHMGRRAVFKYGASLRSRQHMRPNNRVMWEAIRWYADNGFESISLGRTSPTHEGLLQFKRGWAAREEIVPYYRYDLARRSFVEGEQGIGMFSSIFRKMPLPLLRGVGYLVYRHVG